MVVDFEGQKKKTRTSSEKRCGCPNTNQYDGSTLHPGNHRDLTLTIIATELLVCVSTRGQTLAAVCEPRGNLRGIFWPEVNAGATSLFNPLS